MQIFFTSADLILAVSILDFISIRSSKPESSFHPLARCFYVQPPSVQNLPKRSKTCALIKRILPPENRGKAIKKFALSVIEQEKFTN